MSVTSTLDGLGDTALPPLSPLETPGASEGGDPERHAFSVDETRPVQPLDGIVMLYCVAHTFAHVCVCVGVCGDGDVHGMCVFYASVRSIICCVCGWVCSCCVCVCVCGGVCT